MLCVSTYILCGDSPHTIAFIIQSDPTSSFERNFTREIRACSLRSVSQESEGEQDPVKAFLESSVSAWMPTETLSALGVDSLDEVCGSGVS